ncbi:MAG: Dextranase precursor [candidate division BRC1 bacterium ADurb.BinA364]|nr:MAG: Dextranase precursor [candidate division BRC1 bacterium ADurb.BinA364]
MVMESPNHGIVAGGGARIANIKYLGWHCNNDGIRVGGGSEIRDSFLRCVDDHFYNFNIHAHGLTLWAGHNGAILTYGWGGNGTYNSGASLLENIDIIHPEWTSLGNNNGLAASQIDLDYKPYGYGGDTTTILRDIRIEGAIPGLLNLKPRSSGQGILAPPVPSDEVGYLGDLVLEDIDVDGQFGKSQIRGKAEASIDKKKTFFVQNVRVARLRIGEQAVTESNKSDFFEIDAPTVRGIRFEAF